MEAFDQFAVVRRGLVGLVLRIEVLYVPFLPLSGLEEEHRGCFVEGHMRVLRLETYFLEMRVSVLA